MTGLCRNSCSCSSSSSSSSAPTRLAVLLAVTTTYGILMLSAAPTVAAAAAASSVDPSVHLRGGRAFLQHRRSAVAAAKSALASAGATTTGSLHTAAKSSTSSSTSSASSFTPSSAFPYSPCIRNPAGSRLFATANPNVTTLTQASTNTSLTRICFDVQRAPDCAHPGSPCCDFELYKLELEVDPACADSLAFTTIDGVQHVRFFQTRPHASIKIVNMDRLPLPVATADATTSSSNPVTTQETQEEGLTTRQVCLYLRPACNSLAKLCASHDGTCSLALFSRPGAGAANCCPLSRVSL